MIGDDDDDTREGQAKFAAKVAKDLMRDFEDADEVMTDEEVAALRAESAKIAADLDDELERLKRAGKRGGREWQIAENYRKA
jgi:LPS O-antigen subunit length determinant protein (WzzB/FepE family)